MNVLGRYTIIEKLGSGSMGTVYKANDPVLDREVALKTIRTNGTVDPQIRERFYREARACARLQHPNIVAVWDLGEVDQVAFISMELLRGCDIRAVIEQRKPMSVPEKIEAMIQICEGLDHAHRHGVIHRDIKPSNLFVQADGGVKIVDFGIARLPSSRFTLQGNILGTPNYMAPEQILGKPSDGRSDLFSAGLVFFELLVYAHPFHATMIHRRIADGDPDSLFDHDTTLPVLLDGIMSKALAKRPEDRYATCAELAADLRAVLDGIRMNASPTMSKVELPSERAPRLPEIPIEADTTLLKPVPQGEDPAEWRLSEVLRLIPEFEDAVEQNEQDTAKKALEQLKAIAVTDKRFTEAAESCLQTYSQTFGAEPEMQRKELANETSFPAAPADTKSAPFTPYKKNSERESNLLENKLPHTNLTVDQKKVIVGSVIACVVLILVGWASSRLFKTIPQEPAIGDVAVVVPRSFVKEMAKPDAPVILEVNRGDGLRLLEVPADRSAAWLRVQASPGGKTAKPGYIAASDIAGWAEWKFDTPESAAKVALVMAPEDSASTDQLRAFLSRLRGLESPVSGKPEGERVRAEVSRIEAVIAQREPPAPPTPAEPAAPAPASETAQAQPAPTQTPLTADQLVARGRYALDKYNPGRARYYANEALKLDKSHAGAISLLNEILDYNDAFGSQKR